MDAKKIPLKEALFLAAGEATVGVAICLIFLALGKYDYKVLTGAALGVAVAIFNFVFLCISVNRALDKCLEGADFQKDEKASENQSEAASDNSETDEENKEEEDEISKFAKENQAKLASTIKLSYTVRSLAMFAALIIAFTTGQFNVIATLIPLLFSRPLLSLPSLIKGKGK